MPDGAAMSFAGGAAMGFASSLHCVGMCGAVAASLMLSAGGEDGRTRSRALLATQAGRLLGYALAGAAAGGFGSSIVAGLDHPAAYALLRWAAAAALGWIGLSMLGVVPSLAFADRLLAPVTNRIRYAGGARLPTWPPFMLGLGWSLAPCGVALGALIYAGLSGSSAAGATVMAGFGFGTLPAIVSCALGFDRLRALSRRPALRAGAGVFIVSLAILSVVAPHPAQTLLCFG